MAMGRVGAGFLGGYIPTRRVRVEGAQGVKPMDNPVNLLSSLIRLVVRPPCFLPRDRLRPGPGRRMPHFLLLRD